MINVSQPISDGAVQAPRLPQSATEGDGSTEELLQAATENAGIVFPVRVTLVLKNKCCAFPDHPEELGNIECLGDLIRSRVFEITPILIS